MKIALIAAVMALALPMGAAQAQSSSSSTKKAATTSAKAKSTSAKKTVRPKLAPKTAAAVEAMTPVESATSRLTDAELEIAKKIYTGTIQCELGANVTVTADEKNPGFFLVAAGKQRYYMHPVESRTGAIRMEDNRAGALWLQLANKSMLMNQAQGQRIADECATPEQKEFAAQMKLNPPENLLADAPKK